MVHSQNIIRSIIDCIRHRQNTVTMQPNSNYFPKNPLQPKNLQNPMQIPVPAGPVPLELGGTHIKPALQRKKF